MNASQAHNRLARLIGDEQAHELLQAPNFALNGYSPQDLLDQGKTAEVEALLGDLEARESVRRDFIGLPDKPRFDAIDELAGT